MYFNKSFVLEVLMNFYLKGNCGEHTAKKFAITREQQDEFAIRSYTKSAESWKVNLYEKIEL